MSCRARKAAGSQLWKHMKCRLASTWLAVFLPALPVQLASAVLNLWLQVKLSAFCWITEGSWRLGEKKKRCFFFHFEEFPWLNQKKSYNVPKSSKDEGKQLQPIQAPSEQTPLKSLQEWKMSKSATKPLSLSFSGEGVEKQSTCSAKTPFVLSTLMFWISYWCRGCWCSSSPGRRIVPLTFDATAIEQGGRRILQKRLQKIVPQDSQTEWRPITSKATTVFDSMNQGGGFTHTTEADGFSQWALELAEEGKRNQIWERVSLLPSSFSSACQRSDPQSEADIAFLHQMLSMIQKLIWKWVSKSNCHILLLAMVCQLIWSSNRWISRWKKVRNLCY